MNLICRHFKCLLHCVKIRISFETIIWLKIIRIDFDEAGRNRRKCKWTFFSEHSVAAYI